MYARQGHPIPLLLFQDISNNFNTYITKTYINIHGRSERQKTHFKNYITNITSGLLQPLHKHSRQILQTTPNIGILFPNLIHRSHLEV